MVLPLQPSAPCIVWWSFPAWRTKRGRRAGRTGRGQGACWRGEYGAVLPPAWVRAILGRRHSLVVFLGDGKATDLLLPVVFLARDAPAGPWAAAAPRSGHGRLGAFCSVRFCTRNNIYDVDHGRNVCTTCIQFVFTLTANYQLIKAINAQIPTQKRMAMICISVAPMSQTSASP
jgi:hypothetical protein